uniref:DNA-methyltransferase n=1 Tax=Flavobacterium sp. TaxID=239 RepID=UPI00404B15F4
MKLLNGDCLKLLNEIDDNSVDLVFCDLPYGQTDCKWDCKIDLVEMWKQFKRIRKDKHTPFFFTCSTRFGYELIKSNEKWFRYDLVWEKSSPVGFLCAKKMPMRKHEMIYVFYENLPLYDISSHNQKFLKVEEPRTNTLYGDTKGCKIQKYDPPLPTSVIKMHKSRIAGTDHGYGNTNGGEIGSYDPPLPTSVLQFKSERGKHKTQKPTTLMEWILKYYSKEGDTVLDPTMGSGSTGVSCKSMNREFIGIEMDEEIYKVACERLK